MKFIFNLKFIILFCLVRPCLALDIYIDVDSSDTGDGSFDTPFNDIHSALEYVANEVKEKNIRIIFRAGRYELSKPVTLTPKILKDVETIIFKTFENEKVIIAGSKLLNRWEVYDKYKRIVRHKIDFESPAMVLYIDSMFATRAREPNKLSEKSFGPYFPLTGVHGDGYMISKSLWDSYAPENMEGLQLIVKSHWIHHNATYSNHKEMGENVIFLPKHKEELLFFNKNNEFYDKSYFYFEGAFKFLNEEGEWYLDYKDGFIYYKLKANQNAKDLVGEIPKLETLFFIEGNRLRNLSNIEFRGFKFTGTGWAKPFTKGGAYTQFAQPYGKSKEEVRSGNVPPGLIFVKNVKNLRITDNTFTMIGATAIKIHSNADDLIISRNVFSVMGANAIEIDSHSSKNPDKSLKSSGVIIAENIITSTGNVVTNGGAILLHYVSNSLVEKNTICNLPYSGIQVGNQPKGYNDTGTFGNVIKNNHIFNVMQLHDDGGAIYTLGGNQEGTIIEQNYIHDIERSKWAGNWYVDAIYLDNFTQFITVKDNVIKNSNIGGERNNSKNNIFVNNGRDIKEAQVVIANAGAPSELLEKSRICELSNGSD